MIWKSSMEQLGRYFGYPECCIQYFVHIRIESMPPLTPKQEAVHGNTGFIPCPTCAEKVTAETLHTLIHNRSCPHPFPHGKV